MNKKKLIGKSWHLKGQVRSVVADDTLSDDEQRIAIEAVAW